MVFSEKPPLTIRYRITGDIPKCPQKPGASVENLSMNSGAEMTAKLINAWAEFVVKRRIMVLAASLLLLPIFIFSMRTIKFDASNEMWFLKDDPSLAEYEFLKETFGSAQYILIGVPKRQGEESVITAENLRVIHELTEFLEDHDLIDKVSSLSNYQVINGSTGTLEIDDLVEDFDTFEGTPEQISQIRETMKGEILVHDFMIARDFNDTLILARTIYEDSIDDKVRLVNDLNSFITQSDYQSRGYQFYLMGDPVISEGFFTTSMKDQATTFPLMFLLVTFLLIISFRSLAGVFTPWVVIIMSVLGMYALLSAMNWSLNMLNAMLPILVVVVSIGDSIHVLVEYYHFRNEGKDSKESAKGAIRMMFSPCFFTTLTTYVGFTAVAVTKLAPLREYAFLAGSAVWLAFLFSLTTLPAILSFVKTKGNRVEKIIKTGAVARLTANVSPWTKKHFVKIMVYGNILVALALISATQIEVDSNFVKNFKQGTPIRASMEYFDELFNGGLTLEFIFDSGTEDGIKDPQFLNEVLAFQEYAEGLPITGKVNSMINYVRKMNQTLNDENPANYVLPDTRNAIAQYLLMYSLSGPTEDLSDLKSFDDRYLRLSMRIPNMTTEENRVLIGELKDKLAADHPSLKTTITGDMVLWTVMGGYIQDGLVKSFSLAIFTIILCFFILFRSIKYGLLAMIPSLTPIVIAGGIMSAMGIYLDFTTMIVAAVTFGIAVDDTIHVMSRFVRAKREGSSNEEAIHLAITEAGRAVVFSSIILVSGFSMLMFSGFVPNIYFGFFAVVIIFIALISDLYLLPAAIYTIIRSNGSKKGLTKGTVSTKKALGN